MYSNINTFNSTSEAVDIFPAAFNKPRTLCTPQSTSSKLLFLYNNLIIIYLLILRVLHVQMLTRALQYNNYLTVHTQIRKKNYIVHLVTINNEEEKKLKLQQFTVFTIFVIVKITTVLILLKLRYL